MSSSKKFCANRGIEGTVAQLGRDTVVHKFGPHGVVSEIEVDRFSPCDEVLILSGPHSSQLRSGSTHFFIVKKISDGYNNGKIGAIRISANDIESEYPNEYPFAYDKKIIKCTTEKTITIGACDTSKFDVVAKGATIHIISGPHELVGGKYYVCTDKGICGFVDITDDDVAEKGTIETKYDTAISTYINFDTDSVISIYPDGGKFIILDGPFAYPGAEDDVTLARYYVESAIDGERGFATFLESEIGRPHGEFKFYKRNLLVKNEANDVSWRDNTEDKQTIAFLSAECESLKAQLKHAKENHAELQEAFSRQAMNISHVPPTDSATTSEVADIAYRTAASQLVKLARAPISSGHSHMHEILKTDIGGAMISAFLSIGMMALPENEHTERLRKELRIKSAVDASDAIVDLVSGPIRKIISDYASSETDFVNAVKCLPESNKIDAFYVDRGVGVGNNKNK